MAITGELRFASHLDCVRAIERTAARAAIALQFSQGFNPHPILSLAMARPVGVATCDDLVVLALAEPVDAGAGEEQKLVRRLNEQAPRGMEFTDPRLVESKRMPRPRRITCELALDAGRRRAVNARIEELAHAATWPVRRVKTHVGRGPRRPKPRTFDARQLVEAIGVDERAGVLRWTARPAGDLWPRVNEVLSLVGLDSRSDVAGVMRTAVEYDQ